MNTNEKYQQALSKQKEMNEALNQARQAISTLQPVQHENKPELLTFIRGLRNTAYFKQTLIKLTQDELTGIEKEIAFLIEKADSEAIEVPTDLQKPFNEQ